LSDITKCNDSECDKKDSCYRWTAPSEELHQSYFMDSPRNMESDECDLFWKVSEITHSFTDKSTMKYNIKGGLI
jgi:hypothetical protein